MTPGAPSILAWQEPQLAKSGWTKKGQEMNNYSERKKNNKKEHLMTIDAVPTAKLCHANYKVL